MIIIYSASALYYLAELLEEFTVAAKKTISWLIAITMGIYVLLPIFDSIPYTMVIGGLAAQALHAVIMKNFPYVEFLSFPFLGSAVMLFINHWLAFRFFSQNWYQFTEVLSYFTLCVWLVPFALFISLSANDNVLPTVNERSPLLSKYTFYCL